MKRVIGVALLALLAACGDEGEGRLTQQILGPGPNPPGGGPDPFNDRVLATWRLTLDPADWDRIVADPHDNTWRRATVEWQGELYADVAVRPSGNRSRIPGNPKPSLRLEFDELLPGREFHGYSTIKLDAMIHDSTMMHARLEYPVYTSRGVPAPRYAHARLYVNGQYKGLYGVEERVGKEFVRKRLGRPVQQLYRWAASATMHDLLWVGPEPAANYVPRMWVPEIEELPPDAEGVRELCRRLHEDPSRVPEIFDVESFLNLIAAETLLGEGDQYVAGYDGERSANIHLYRAPATGKYMILPWDCDQGFWRPETGITHGFGNRVLTRVLILGNPAHLARYRQVLRELIAGPFATERVHARVEDVLAQIRAAAYEDPLKPWTSETFEARVQALKRYVADRNAAFLGQLAGPP